MALRDFYAVVLIVAGILSGCAEPVKQETLQVTATAYTSSKRQTDKTPFLAAWNNKIKPGMKCIAVSRDLLDLGLTNGCEVSIDGLDGRYLVLDKMHKRWEKKIDIYMGLDTDKALEWGKQRVTIRWEAEPQSIQDANQSLSLSACFSDGSTETKKS